MKKQSLIPLDFLVLPTKKAQATHKRLEKKVNKMKTRQKKQTYKASKGAKLLSLYLKTTLLGDGIGPILLICPSSRSSIKHMAR
jgi:hypothetical protein